MWTSDDIVGALAASLVLLAFCMKTMPALRMVALASNVAFVTYALRLELWPILALHSILIPINLYGLFRSVTTLSSVRTGDTVRSPCGTGATTGVRG